MSGLIQNIASLPTEGLAFGDVKIPSEWLCEEYVRRAPRWRLFGLCYEGGDEFIRSTCPKTLFTHAREPGPSYAQRLERASYRNHCGAIVGLKADAILQPQVSRAHDGDKDFPAFVKDVDLKGTNADPFWNEVARGVMTYGRYWVGISMASDPALVAQAQREGRRVRLSEARAARIRPYLWQAKPSSVIDWKEDAQGRLEYAVVITREEQREPLRAQGRGRTCTTYATVYTREKWTRYIVGPRGGAAKDIEQAHPFGEVPLVPIVMRSQLEDLDRLGLKVYNLDSLADEQLYRQIFNQLVGKVKDKTEFQQTVAGTDTVILLNAENAEELAYLTPSTAPVELILRTAWETADEMWSMAHLRSRPGGKGSQPATETSGVAYAFEHKEAETDLANIATRLEEADTRLMRMRAVAVDSDPEKVSVHYPRSYDVRALLAQATETQAILMVGVGKTATAELRKALVRKALPRATAETLAVSFTEIDAMAEAVATAPGPAPPNQSLQPAGAGAGGDRTQRAAQNVADESQAEGAAA